MQKIIILLVICFGSLIGNNGYSQNWIWANHIGGKLSDGIKVHCVDSDNNVYISGAFESDTCYLTPSYYLIRKATSSYFSDPAVDMFVAKFDSSGSVIWAKQFGSTFTDHQYIVSMTYNEKTSSLCMVGSYSGAADFDSFHLNSPLGEYDAFIASMDLDGNFRWAKRIEGNEEEYASDIDTDENGNIYIVCQMPIQGLIDSVHVGNGNYLVKFNPQGKSQWILKKSIGFPFDFYQIIVKKNKLFVLAEENSSSNFVIDSISYINNKNVGRHLLICFDSQSGIAQWIRELSGDYSLLSGFEVDDQKNIYIASHFSQRDFW